MSFVNTEQMNRSDFRSSIELEDTAGEKIILYSQSDRVNADECVMVECIVVWYGGCVCLCMTMRVRLSVCARECLYLHYLRVGGSAEACFTWSSVTLL